MSNKSERKKKTVRSPSYKSIVATAEAYLVAIQDSCCRSKGWFGDEESVVYFLSRGRDCDDAIEAIHRAWSQAERRSREEAEEYTRRLIADSGLLATNRYLLPNFWEATALESPFVDSTMLRVCELTGINDFDSWWQRLAREVTDEVAESGLVQGEDYACHLIFSMCRSGFAVSMMEYGMVQLLDAMENSGSVPEQPWIRRHQDKLQPLDSTEEPRCSMKFAASMAFASLRVRSDPGMVTTSAVQVLVEHQDEDGVWALWEGQDEPDMLTTLMAVHVLCLAQPRGWKGVVKKATKWISSHQDDRGRWRASRHSVPNECYLTVLALDALALARGDDCTTLTDTPTVRQGKLFVPTPMQKAILKALEGRALKKDPLANEVCAGEGRTLYKPGGIRELRGRGLVAHKDGVGFYRPDAPPDGAIFGVPK
jgi:hypothetical protein